MNFKQAKFEEFLTARGIREGFMLQELAGQTEDAAVDELQTTLAFAYFEVAEEKIPLKIVLDNTDAVLVQARVSERKVSSKRKSYVLEQLNQYNDDYKAFKHYVDEDGHIIVESCLFTDDSNFSPEILYKLINCIASYIDTEYANLLKVF